MKHEILEFLRESNAIEGEYDAVSLEQAIFAWDYLMEQKKMTIGIILKTHKILMLHTNLMPNEKGYFRTIPVYVGGRAGMDYEKIEGALQSWCQRMTKRKEDTKGLHIEYEKIHPFVDGNGRSGRLFLLWLYVKLELPIKIIYEKDRQEYYKWFH